MNWGALIIPAAVIAGLIAAYGLFKLMDYMLILPTGNTKTTMRTMFGRNTLSKQITHSIIEPIAEGVSKHIKLPIRKKRKLLTAIERLNIKETPEHYVAKAIIRSVFMFIPFLVFIPMGIPILSIVGVIIAVLMYHSAQQHLLDDVVKQNKQITEELPRMLETLNYTLKDNYDLLAFFEKYRLVAGPAMGSAIDRLIVDLKLGNQEQALRDFDERLGVPQVTALVAVLMGVTRGVDQRTALLIMEQDVRVTQREILRRELEKRPNGVKVSTIILMLLMVALMMVPLVAMIVSQFTVMN